MLAYNVGLDILLTRRRNARKAHGHCTCLLKNISRIEFIVDEVRYAKHMGEMRNKFFP